MQVLCISFNLIFITRAITTRNYVAS